MKPYIGSKYVYRLYIVITYFIFVIVASSCKEKCNEYYLGPLVSMNPYSGTEKLIFNNSEGENIIFNGMGRVVRMNTISPTGSGDICEKSEWDNCYFDEENGLFDIKILLRPSTYYTQSFISLMITDYEYNDIWPYLSIFEFYIPLNKDNLREDQFFHDSLNIQGITYYDIFASEPGSDTSPTIKYTTKRDTIHPSMIFYHLVSGIIKVDFDDGSTWELKEIIP